MIEHMSAGRRRTFLGFALIALLAMSMMQEASAEIVSLTASEFIDGTSLFTSLRSEEALQFFWVHLWGSTRTSSASTTNAAMSHGFRRTLHNVCTTYLV